jgi:hypothetical protein
MEWKHKLLDMIKALKGVMLCLAGPQRNRLSFVFNCVYVHETFTTIAD